MPLNQSPFVQPGQLEKEAKLRTLIESVPNGIIMVNERGKITLCNSEAERMFGYGRNELLGMPVERLVPSKVRDKHPSYRAGFLHDPSKRQMGAGRDLTGIRKDGAEIPVEIGLNHIKADDGLFVVASIVDITERKKQEEKFRTIVESVPNGIIMVDTTGSITLSNSEAEKMFGYGRGELLGKKVEALVPMRYQGNHPRDRDRFIDHPQKRQMGAGRDLSGLKKDGTEIPVESGSTRLKRRRGGTYWHPLLTSVSARRSTTSSIARMKKCSRRTRRWSNSSIPSRTILKRRWSPACRSWASLRKTSKAKTSRKSPIRFIGWRRPTGECRN
jgi:PAS domain S-box-containing protein